MRSYPFKALTLEELKGSVLILKETEDVKDWLLNTGKTNKDGEKAI